MSTVVILPDLSGLWITVCRIELQIGVYNIGYGNIASGTISGITVANLIVQGPSRSNDLIRSIFSIMSDEEVLSTEVLAEDWALLPSIFNISAELVRMEPSVRAELA